MKRIPIPPSAVYGVIKERGPLTIDEIGICSRSHALEMTHILRDAGVVYISGWRNTGVGRYRMLLSAGSGTDAPIPCRSPEEQMALDIQRRRARREANRPNPPVPKLPDYTPTYGVWGI
jgi:hypothetical protein